MPRYVVTVPVYRQILVEAENKSAAFDEAILYSPPPTQWADCARQPALQENQRLQCVH